MMKQMKEYFSKVFGDKKLVKYTAWSFAFLFVAFVINFFANQYATVKVSNPVTDIVLSNTRAVDVDGLFIYGPIIFWIIIAYFLVKFPNKIPFTIFSIGLFIIIRDAFICMTHIGPFPTQSDLGYLGVMRFLFSGGDLFFSGHTGAPFLMALVFWDHKVLRWVYIFAAIFFGAVVLLGHFHYSIDVASAFFITYTIYVLATKFFKRSLEIFNQEQDYFCNKK